MKRILKTIKILVFYLVCQLSYSAAIADTLDFVGEIGTGFQSANISMSNATLNGSGTQLFFSAPGTWGSTHGSFCSFTPDDCTADLEIEFNSKVFDLSFETFVFDAGDSFIVSAFNGAAFLGSTEVLTDGLVDLSGFGLLDRLFFDDRSNASGSEYGSFDFKVSSVPLPSSLFLFLTALTGVGFLSRRLRTNSMT